jgi:hypothetical protein
LLEGREAGALEEYEQGSPALCRMASILSKTAGAREEISSPFNGLIAWPAQTGEDRISLCATSPDVAGSGVGSNLDTP